MTAPATPTKAAYVCLTVAAIPLFLGGLLMGAATTTTPPSDSTMVLGATLAGAGAAVAAILALALSLARRVS